MNKKSTPKKKEGKSWVKPLIAVVGFFAILFIAAYFLHLFHSWWIIPVGIIAAIAWAVAFSMEKDPPPREGHLEEKYYPNENYTPNANHSPTSTNSPNVNGSPIGTNNPNANHPPTDANAPNETRSPK